MRSLDLIVIGVLLILLGDWVGNAGPFILLQVAPAIGAAVIGTATSWVIASTWAAFNDYWTSPPFEIRVYRFLATLAVLGVMIGAYVWTDNYYAVQVGKLAAACRFAGVIVSLFWFLHARTHASYRMHGGQWVPV